MANLAGFVIGNAIGGTRAGLVASLMPSPVVGAIVAQAFAEREDEGDIQLLRRRFEREQEDVDDLQARLLARRERLWETRAELARAEREAEPGPDDEHGGEGDPEAR